MRVMRCASALGLAVLVLASCSRPKSAEGPITELEPDAAELVRKMSDELAAAQTLKVKTETVRQHVRYDGSLVERQIAGELVIRRPDAFWIHRVVDDGGTQNIVYDGTHVAFQNDDKKVWGSVAAPPTLDAVVEYLADSLRVPIPTADIFQSDPYAVLIGPETLGRVLGREEIGGRQCEHVTLIDPAVDFELWISAQEPAFPCRMRLVHKSIEQRPSTTVNYSDWQPGVELPADQFAFTPPADYRRIPVIRVPPLPDEKTGAGAAVAPEGDPEATDEATESGA